MPLVVMWAALLFIIVGSLALPFIDIFTETSLLRMVLLMPMCLIMFVAFGVYPIKLLVKGRQS